MQAEDRGQRANSDSAVSEAGREPFFKNHITGLEAPVIVLVV
jgi:hypothetical protein